MFSFDLGRGLWQFLIVTTQEVVSLRCAVTIGAAAVKTGGTAAAKSVHALGRGPAVGTTTKLCVLTMDCRRSFAGGRP